MYTLIVCAVVIFSQEYAAAARCSLDSVELVGTVDDTSAIGSVAGLCTVGARWNQDARLLEESSLLINTMPCVFLSIRRARSSTDDPLGSVRLCPVLDCSPNESKSGSMLFHLELPAHADASVSASFVHAVFFEPYNSSV